MPRYSYICPTCETRVERIKKIAERFTNEKCPECDATMARRIEAPMVVGADSGGRNQ